MSRRAYALRWGRLAAGTGAAQVAVQGFGFLAGIITIWLLPQEQYAYYTLGNSMLATMTILADSGISTGVMSLGGQRWRERDALGTILATGLQLRRRFALLSALVVLPILFALTYRQSGSVWVSGVVCAAIMPAFLSALSYSLLTVAPKLHQEIREIMRVNLAVSGLKLVLSLLLLFVFPYFFVALLIIGASQIFGNYRIRDLVSRLADYGREASKTARAEILSFVKRVLPGTIYYCLSGQLTVLVLSAFGQTEDIASVGALGRLMVLMTLVTALLDLLVVPRYAKLQRGSRAEAHRFWQSVGLASLLCSGVVLGVWLFPEQVLWVLGPKYADLQREAFLMTVGTCLTVVSGTMHRLASSRDIIPSPQYFVTTVALTQVAALVFVADLSSVASVLTITIYTATVSIVYRMIHFHLTVARRRSAAGTE